MVNIIVIISIILNTISKPINSFYTIMVSRFLAGIYSGLFSGILPLYLSECSSKNLRGLTGTMNQLSIVTGVLAANIIGLPSLLGLFFKFVCFFNLTKLELNCLENFTQQEPKSCGQCWQQALQFQSLFILLYF